VGARVGGEDVPKEEERDEEVEEAFQDLLVI
jgi:hypothetical protein